MTDITANISNFTAPKGSVYIIFHNSDAVLLGKKKTCQHYHPVPYIPKNKKPTQNYKGKDHELRYTTIEGQAYSIYPNSFPCNLNNAANGDPLDDLSKYYCFPGGKLDRNENVARAARREFYEETGIDLSHSRFADCQITLKEYVDGSAKYYAYIVKLPDNDDKISLQAEAEAVNDRINDTMTNFVNQITSSFNGYQALTSKPAIPDDELLEVLCLDRAKGWSEYFVDADKQGWYQNIYNDLFA